MLRHLPRRQRTAGRLPRARSPSATCGAGTPTQNGSAGSVTAASYTTAIATNGSVMVGFTGTRTTANAAPMSFTLNRTTCATS
ncbi:cellulose binding domain-containing protein [Streptomyces hygroscopicus]|uniref:cellulose binding domain-containing protein n=1 Tax=Streptomyces hygroscopicus TaxID=1912 RepID=UPI0036BB98DB